MQRAKPYAGIERLEPRALLSGDLGLPEFAGHHHHHHILAQNATPTAQPALPAAPKPAATVPNVISSRVTAAQFAAKHLLPGTGFTGPTPQPDPIGTGPYSDAKAIARWDVVPYQTFTATFNVGVVAFHSAGIDRVEFSVNGGAWRPVTQMTLNPRTNVVEYWATLQASDFQDGAVEVRAVAFPTVGIPRVLDPMPLNSDGQSTLPALTRYVSPQGSDTTGDGTQANPYATIMQAAHDIQVGQGTNADGGTIYLQPGDYVYGTSTWPLTTITCKSWLTIAPAPGVTQAQVRLVKAGNSDGIRTKLVHIQGLTIQASTAADQVMLTSNGPLVDYLWLDGCRLIGPGRTVDGFWINGWTDQYITDTDISNCRDGITGSLVRNVSVHDIGSDGFDGGGLIVNSSVNGIDNTGTFFHPDVVQLSNGQQNFIAYGLTSLVPQSQGIFADATSALTDIALVNCNINNQAAPDVMAVFQFGGPVTNMYVDGCRFTGPAYWRVDKAFSATEVVVRDTYFSIAPIPGTIAGVIYESPTP